MPFYKELIIEAINQERNELNEQIDNIPSFDGLSFSKLSFFFAMLASLVVFLSIKVFFVHRIYYSSRHITQLQAKYELLYEENKFFKKELENLRFQYRITNLED